MATGDTGKQLDPKKLADAIRSTPLRGKKDAEWASEVWKKAQQKGGKG